MRPERCVRDTTRLRRLTTMGVMILIAAGLCVRFSTEAVAQRVESGPAQLEGVGIDDHSGDTLPFDLAFVDESGATIEMGSLFPGDRPVILSMTYSDCPMLCHLQLDGLVRSLQDLQWSPGEQFDVVNVSINPKETWQRARDTKKKHVQIYGRPESAAGWHFLTGSEANVHRLADSLGFRYRFVPERNEYAHAACLFVCTPEGQISRYLYGVVYPAQSVRLALVEAGEGKIGTAFDQILLFCFHYDAESGKYAPLAFRIMQIGAAFTLGVLAICLVPYWSFRRRRGNTDAVPPAEGLTAKSATPVTQETP